MLKGKRILAVDDEPDVLDTIREILPSCHVDTAGDYARACRLFNCAVYDIAILDIMGVRGLELIDEAVQRQCLPVMLTAPAFNPRYLVASFQRGAVSYLPKEDLVELERLLTELLEIIQRGESPWAYTLKRLEPLFGPQFIEEWKLHHDPMLRRDR